MHDPDVQVFEIHVPIPVVRWKVKTKRDGLRRRRWTGDGPRAGKPMRFLLRPEGWELVLGGHLIGWWNVLEVWHHEPGGRDAHTTCKGRKGSHLTWHNIRWAWTHRKHLNIYSPPWRRVVRWRTDRCAECGKRFRWKGDARFGVGWSGREVLHDKCSSLRHVQSQLADATAVLQFTADENARWRVEQRLKHLETPQVGAP